VREIGQRLGVDPTGLYRIVKRLADDGRVRKDGPRVHPAGSTTALARQPEATDASAAPAETTAQAREGTAPAEPKSSA